MKGFLKCIYIGRNPLFEKREKYYDFKNYDNFYQDLSERNISLYRSALQIYTNMLSIRR